MKFFIKNVLLEEEKSDCIVIGVFEFCEFKYSNNYLNKSICSYINNFIKKGDMQGKVGETLLLYDVPNVVSKRILLVGCGKKID